MLEGVLEETITGYEQLLGEIEEQVVEFHSATIAECIKNMQVKIIIQSDFVRLLKKSRKRRRKECEDSQRKRTKKFANLTRSRNPSTPL